MFATQCHLAFSRFFFNDTATTEIYTLSLHDALPISILPIMKARVPVYEYAPRLVKKAVTRSGAADKERSEEHTSELPSRPHLLCRLLLEKKTPSPFPARCSGATR